MHGSSSSSRRQCQVHVALCTTYKHDFVHRGGKSISLARTSIGSLCFSIIYWLHSAPIVLSMCILTLASLHKFSMCAESCGLHLVNAGMASFTSAGQRHQEWYIRSLQGLEHQAGRRFVPHTTLLRGHFVACVVTAPLRDKCHHTLWCKGEILESVVVIVC